MKKSILVLAILFLFGATTVSAAEVTLAWDANNEPDLAGYKIYWGFQSGKYPYSVDVGNVTQFTIKYIEPGVEVFYAATAYDDANNESGYSEELAHTVPEPPLVDNMPPGAPLTVRVISWKISAGIISAEIIIGGGGAMASKDLPGSSSSGP